MNIYTSETEYLKTEVQRLSALVRAQQITIDKLEQALNTATPLAAPVQEPDAFDCGVYLGKGKDHAIKHHVSYQPAPVQEPVESWEDLHNALQRIDTAAVGLPTFEVRHEGGLDEVVQNIVDAIVALHVDHTAAQRQRVVFPTMLRKMWSGGEVQAWLDENVNKENT